MKAILEFDLDNPDDVQAHYRCVMATDMAIALWELSQLIHIAEKQEIDDYLEWFDDHLGNIFENADFNLDRLLT